MDLQPNLHKQLIRPVNGINYARYPIKTHVVAGGENVIDLIKKYMAPHLVVGDVIFISEKMVAITQNRSISIKDIKPSWLAEMAVKFTYKNPGGLGIATPWTMQMVIQEAGLPRFLLASLASIIGKLFGVAFKSIFPILRNIPVQMKESFEKSRAIAVAEMAKLNTAITTPFIITPTVSTNILGKKKITDFSKQQLKELEIFISKGKTKRLIIPVPEVGGVGIISARNRKQIESQIRQLQELAKQNKVSLVATGGAWDRFNTKLSGTLTGITGKLKAFGSGLLLISKSLLPYAIITALFILSDQIVKLFGSTKENLQKLTDEVDNFNKILAPFQELRTQKEVKLGVSVGGIEKLQLFRKAIEDTIKETQQLEKETGKVPSVLEVLGNKMNEVGIEVGDLTKDYEFAYQYAQIHSGRQIDKFVNLC